ncbi:AMP-binding enzyme domain-containing protein [Cladophialophora immunda]|nr:AMP-binding enzyme domain-containing protein [Cladophialophora immunda]
MESTLQSIQDYQLEEVLLVPPILIRMVRNSPLLERYNLSSLRRLMSGAAPLSAEILTLLQQCFPNTGFKQGYGMTESCSCITLHPPDKYDYKYATQVGTIVPSTEVKFVDPQTRKECGVNQPGEIWARGPQVVMGYLNNKKATEETFDAEGFLHTGDIGSIDEEGMVSITDRLKEMIKVNGIGVAPAELEDLLLGHEDVEDVAVLGVRDEYVGERPKAYVVAKLAAQQQANLDTLRKRLIEFVQERKARYKWIAEIEFIDEIPKSASGKILRRVLRDAMPRRGSDGILSKDNTRAAKM